MSRLPLGPGWDFRTTGGLEEDSPLVTAVMVTGKSADRYPMARRAARCFLAQTYQNKELVVVNDGAEPLGVEDRRVRELRVGPGRYKLGGLRNVGLDGARGRWVIQWDDDDWHHPGRIALQMAARWPGAAVTLGWQVRHDIKLNTSFYCYINNGIAGTILHQAGISIRYPDVRRSEDSAFYRLFRSRVVVENRPGQVVGAVAYVRFFHGGNTWHRRHIMGPYADRFGVSALRQDDEWLISRLRARYGNSGS